jgi:hypothetical protein
MKKYLLRIFTISILILTHHQLCTAMFYQQQTIQIDTLKHNIKINDAHPLSYPTFRKMMRGQYNFALVGSQTPTYGITLETVNPKITLKSNIYQKNKVILNLELSGGTTDGLFKLYSNDKLNSILKGSFGLNYSFDWLNKGYYKSLNDIEKLKVHDTKNDLIGLTKQHNALINNHIIYKILTGPRLDLNDKSNTYEGSMIEKFENYKTCELNTQQEKILLKHTTNLMKIYADGIDTNNTFHKNYNEFYQVITNITDTVNRNALLRNATKGAKLFEKINDTIPDLEIKEFKPLYNSLRIAWINFSPNFENIGYQSFEEIGQTFAKKNAVQYGANVSYNFYQKSQRVKSKFFFGQVGIGINRVNSLIEKTRFSYEKTIEKKNSNGERLFDKTSGIAYEGNIKFGLGLEVFAEAYWMFWNNTNMPGFYLKSGLQYGYPWINEYKWPLAAGLVFSVVSDKKDAKNLFTVIPYGAWTNMIDEKNLTDRTKTTPLHNLFEVGVKVGIPINIGK